MKKPVPRRARVKYTEFISGMKPKAHLYFAGANPSSIKAIACRIGLSRGRTYFTQNEQAGVSVWREK